MPPKKNNTDLAQKVVKKSKRNVKPVKPPLKTPLLIRLQVSNLDSESPKFTRKVEKIDQANAVAQAQLVKSTIVSPKPICSPVVNLPEPSKKSTLNRKKKMTPKVVLGSSECDETPLANKATKEKLIATVESGTRNRPKRKRKLSVEVAKNEDFDLTHENPAKRLLSENIALDASDLEASEPKIKRPGPKPRTAPQSRKKLVAKLIPETIELAVKPIIRNLHEPITKAKKGGKKGQPNVVSDFFCEGPVSGTILEPEEIHKTSAGKVNKRKQTRKKAVQEKNDSKVVESITRRTRVKPRSKFVCERAVDKNSSSPATRSRPKGKVLRTQEIKTAATKLEDTLNAVHVVTRSNSVNSNKSSLSWTRDISTESNMTTTTCITVSSNDIVRFNNKLPFVQVDNTLNLEAEGQIKAITETANFTEQGVKTSLLEESSSSDSSSSESSSSHSSTDSETDVPVSNSELNLSTSSLTLKSQEPELTPSYIELLCIQLDELNTSLNNFHSELGECIKREDIDTMPLTQILYTMNLEGDILHRSQSGKCIIESVIHIASPEDHSQCERTTRRKDTEVTGQNGTRVDREDCSPEGGSPGASGRMDCETTNQHSENDTRPCSIAQSIAKNSGRIPKNTINVPAVSEKGKNISGRTETSDNFNYTSFERTYDDEDALSLFAESISGMEGSRRGSVASVSNVSNPDLYIPKPTRPWLREKYVYEPTRIEEIPLKTIEPNMIKKQNADSSSISKDTAIDINKKAMDSSLEGNACLPPDSVKIRSPQQCTKRLFNFYQPMSPVKSCLYQGQCFFNLAYICKNPKCRFPHGDINRIIFKCRLTILHEDVLIQEYLLARNFKTLRQKFCLLFVEECKRRKSTRILMEMAIDLGLGIIEREDQSLITDVLEATLLHLNTISFDACDDQLKFEFNKVMLCDVLLLRVSNSQNFAQFKHVFVKLANFMWEIKRAVDIEVASSILERVCILPGEEHLARGMLTLMQNTNPTIFENNMAKSFEVQLSNIESDVFDAYLLAKKAAIYAQLEDCMVPEDSDGPHHIPPDTTTLDSLKKAQMAQRTVFKCTINTDAISGSEAIRDLFKSPNPVPKQRYTIPRQKVGRNRQYPLQHQRGALRVPASVPTGAPARGRGRIVSGGRTVYRTQTLFRNGPNS